MKGLQNYILKAMGMEHTGGWKGVKSEYSKLNISDYPISKKINNETDTLYIKVGNIKMLTSIKLEYDIFGELLNKDNYKYILKSYDINAYHISNTDSSATKIKDVFWFIILKDGQWEMIKLDIRGLKIIIDAGEYIVYTINNHHK